MVLFLGFSRFRVSGTGFRGSGFRVLWFSRYGGFWFSVKGFRGSGFGVRGLGMGFRAQGFGHGFSRFGVVELGVSGLGLRVS